MEGSILRAAIKTYSGWEDMHLKLAEKPGSVPIDLKLSQTWFPWLGLPCLLFQFVFSYTFEGMKFASACKRALARALYEWRAKGESMSLQKRVFSMFCPCPPKIHGHFSLIPSLPSLEFMIMF